MSVLVESQRPFVKVLDNLSHYFAVAIAFFIPLSTTLTDICFVAAVVTSLFIPTWQKKWLAIKSSRIAFYFLALFVLFVLGISYTSAPFKDVSQMLLKYDRLLLGILLIPLFIEEKWRKLALYAFLLAMMVTLFLSYVRYFGLFNFKTKYYDVSIFKDHIQQNFLMAFTGYFLALQMFENSKLKYRLLIGLLLVLTVYNTLFISEGRSGYVVLIALLLLFVWQTLRWKGLFLGIISVLVLLSTAFLFSNTFKDRVQAIGVEFQQYIQGQRETSVGQRMNFDSLSFELVKKHPLIGTGTGSFKTEFNKISAPNERTSNPHNEYFNMMIQLGIFGLIVLLSIFYMTLYYSKYLPVPYKFLAQALTVVMVLGCSINSWLMDTTEGHFYVYFIALCFATLKAGSLATSSKHATMANLAEKSFTY